jgi:hypothetical protein
MAAARQELTIEPRWVDAPQLLHEGTVYGVMLSGPTYLERAIVERRMGRSAQAAEYYREFLRRVDRPTPRYQPRLDEVREALMSWVGADQ